MARLTRDRHFGMYEGTRVMIVAAEDPTLKGPDSLVEIEYTDPLSDQPEGARRIVRWGDVGPTL